MGWRRARHTPPIPPLLEWVEISSCPSFTADSNVRFGTLLNGTDLSQPGLQKVKTTHSKASATPLAARVAVP